SSTGRCAAMRGWRRALVAAGCMSPLLPAGLAGRAGPSSGRHGSDGCPAQPGNAAEAGGPNGRLPTAPGGRSVVTPLRPPGPGGNLISSPGTRQRHAALAAGPGAAAVPAGHPADPSCFWHRPPAARYHADTPHIAGCVCSPSRVMRGRPSARHVGGVSSPEAPDGYSLRRDGKRLGVVMGAERDRVAGFGRLEDGLLQAGEWYRWGPYVSERQWGTVREDYSADGDAWDYLPHDHARSRAYRWGEDGLAGFSDIHQRLCLSLALWNGRDSILKERAFGLTGPQGNHGEDVKEYWWYLDAVPSHSWNRWRYHYPQAPYPYQDLIDTNAGRNRYQPEYELIDTGVFDDDRYWITEVHYAKAGPDDLLMAIQLTNAGPETDTVHVLPTAWFRNTWSWGGDEHRPSMRA